MSDKLDTLLTQLSKKAIDDVGSPFSWMINNFSFVQENVDALQEKVASPLAYALLINLLLMKKDFSQAAYHIYLFKKKYPQHAFTHTLSALYFMKTNQLELAYKELRLILNKYNSYYIWELILDCSVELKWFDIGVNLSQKAQKTTHWNTNILLNFLEYEAYCQHYNFEFEKSIAIRREEINLLISAKDIIKANTPQQNFDTSVAWKSLIDILSLLEANNIKAFPTAGTLLGWQRENAILPFDKDLDIAVMPDTDIAMVKVLLEKNPRYEFSSSLPAFTSYLSIIDKQTLYTIDILKFWKNKGFYEYGWLLPKPYKHESRILKFSPFNLIKDEWDGVAMYIPDNADLFLRELYGDWRTPDENYFSILCNNLTKITRLTDSSSYGHIVRNLREGNYKKVDLIIQRLQALGNADEILVSLKEKLISLEKQ